MAGDFFASVGAFGFFGASCYVFCKEGVGFWHEGVDFEVGYFVSFVVEVFGYDDWPSADCCEFDAVGAFDGGNGVDGFDGDEFSHVVFLSFPLVMCSVPGLATVSNLDSITAMSLVLVYWGRWSRKKEERKISMTVQELKDLLDEYTESLGVDSDEEVRIALMQSYTNLSISIDDVDLI